MHRIPDSEICEMFLAMCQANGIINIHQECGSLFVFFMNKNHVTVLVRHHLVQYRDHHLYLTGKAAGLLAERQKGKSK